MRKIVTATRAAVLSVVGARAPGATQPSVGGRPQHARRTVRRRR